MANSNATKEALKCTASIAADSIVDAISIITGVLFSDQKTSFSQIRLRLRLRPNLSSEIRPNSASAEFEKVKFGATLKKTHRPISSPAIYVGAASTTRRHRLIGGRNTRTF